MKMSRKILIVEDSPSEMKLIKSLLDGRGFDIVTAEDGEQAIAQCNHHHPDLVLLDVILPKKNGFQVCRHIKTDPETMSTKVIIVSSKDQEADRFWGLKQGADDYITKPFLPEFLLSSVERYL